MSKRKLNVFLDVLTILLCLFPLVMALATAIFNGSFDVVNIGDYVCQYSISSELEQKISDSMNYFGIAFDGEFYSAALVILSNTLLIYIFRVFAAVMVFIPKMALKFINLDFGGKVS